MRTTRTSGGLRPDGPEDGHDSFVHADNFARAVDGDARTSAPASDPSLDRELAVVAALRQAGTMVEANAQERDRMRQRIMAEFPSVVHEGTSPVLPLRTPGLGGFRRLGSGRTGSGRTGSGRTGSGRRRVMPHQTRGRFVVAAAAALCLLMSLSGMSLLLSRDALPGDTLYAFKRSAESAELGLTFGDEQKALKHLEFANARVGELETLANQADAARTWSTGEEKFLRALEDFEADTRAGTRLVTSVAATGQTGVLAPLSGWVEQQDARLNAVRGAVPLPVSSRLTSTLDLLDRVSTRMAALNQRAGCNPIASDTHDDLGLLPAQGACRAARPNGTSAATPLPEAENIPGAGQAEGVLPPGLLAPPAEAPAAPELGQPGELGLPSPEGVLPMPGKPGGGPVQPPVPGGVAPPSVLPMPLPGEVPLLPLESPTGE